MSKSRYTITTTGNQTVIHLESAHDYPIVEFGRFQQVEGAARTRPAKPKPAKRRTGKDTPGKVPRRAQRKSR